MKYINSVVFDTTPISKTKTKKRLFILGDQGAVFSVYVIRNNDNYYYDFVTKTFQATPTRLLQQELTETDTSYYVDIVFPTVTDNKDYDIFVYAESHFQTEFLFSFEESLLYRVKNEDNRLNSDGTYYLSNTTNLPSSLYQFTDITLSLAITHTDTAVTRNADESSNSDYTGVTNTNLSYTASPVPRFKIEKPRGKIFGNLSTNFAIGDTFENKFTANFLPKMQSADHSMQFARKPLLSDFYHYKAFTIAGTSGNTNSSSTTHSLTSVDGLRVGDKLILLSTTSGSSSGVSLSANTFIKSIDTLNKTITTTVAATMNPANEVTIQSFGLGGIYGLYKWNVKITNLTGALVTVNHPSTGKATDFNFVTTKSVESQVAGTGTTCKVTSSKGIGTGDTISAIGLTTSTGAADGAPITVASVDNASDPNTITLSATLQNNGQILENTPMFFKGSALLAKISFDIEVLEVGDTACYLYLDLDNVLTITDES